MVDIRPLLMEDEAWLKPAPAGFPMIFCGESDGFAQVTIEIDLEASSVEHWIIKAVRLRETDLIRAEHPENKIKFRHRYEELTGELLMSAKDWLHANHQARLLDWMDQEWLPCSIGAYDDIKREATKHD